MTDITLVWQKDVHFIAEDSEKNTVNIDGSTEIGGNNQGTRPMMMVLMGLAGCASIDIVTILKKSKQPLKNFRIKVAAQRSEEIPKVFTDILLTFDFQGDIDEKKAHRAVALSLEKYCSVASMLNKTAKISHLITINP